MLRNVVEANGGVVLRHWANGPNNWINGTFGQGSQKVKYKLVTTLLSKETTNKILFQLHFTSSEIERAYLSVSKHIHVIFNCKARRD